jgi:hypothetical protein
VAADVVAEQVVPEQHAAGRAGDLRWGPEFDVRIGPGIHLVDFGQRVGTALGQVAPEPEVGSRPDPQVAAIGFAVIDVAGSLAGTGAGLDWPKSQLRSDCLGDPGLGERKVFFQ